MAITEAHESSSSGSSSRWINLAAWELQQHQIPKTTTMTTTAADGAFRDGSDGGAWEVLKDWESITLLYTPPTMTMSSATLTGACGNGGANENCSILQEVLSAMVKAEPDEILVEIDQHRLPEALKLGLKLGRQRTENENENEVFKGCCDADPVAAAAGTVMSSTTSTTTAMAAAAAAVAPPAVVVSSSSGSYSSSPPSSKKQRVMSPGSQNARCQVEGCGADLSSCKEYHRKHKVCEMHSKASRAMAGGREQRFCQQCSRFHVLTEFDEGKRSCRRRLAGHNERRRKLQPDAAQNNPTAIGSRSSSPMHTPDALHIHGGAVSLSLEDCRRTQLLQQIRGSGGMAVALDDGEEHSHPLANGANLSCAWSDENVQAQQHQQVQGKEEEHSIFLDHHSRHHHHGHFPSSPSTNRLLMFLQSPDRQMQGGALTTPSLDVALSNLSPPPPAPPPPLGCSSSHEFANGGGGGANKRLSSLGQNLSLGGLEDDDYHNLRCNDSQSSGRALSLLSWGTPCAPAAAAAAALDLGIDNTTLEYLVTDNNTCSNVTSSFTHHLHQQQQQPQEQYLALEKLYHAQSGALGGMEVSESSRITDDGHPLEQSTQLQHGGGMTSGNFLLSSLGGSGLDAANSMLALFQSSNELERMQRCGSSRSSSGAHQISKVTSCGLVHTPSLQAHHHHHQQQQQQHLHEARASVHLQTQSCLNGDFGEYGAFGSLQQQRCEQSLFSSTQQQQML